MVCFLVFVEILIEGRGNPAFGHGEGDCLYEQKLGRYFSSEKETPLLFAILFFSNLSRTVFIS